MKEFHKLVRDHIPEIISQTGQTAVIRVMEDDEYRLALEKKLDEEVQEYHESKEIEELADILEVVYALCESQGCSVDDLTAVCQKKRAERGGFSKKICLIGTEDAAPAQA